MDKTILKFDNFLWDYLKKDSYKTYYQFLIEKNKVMNLTNITEEKDVYEKHFYDSVILQKAIDIKNKSLLDVGSGAGFPSLPLKLYDNSLKVTIVDSLNKRILFLRELVEKLDLKNIELIHSRAEELEEKEAYDIVTARAVARLNILLEMTLPYVKLNGYFVAFKSINYEDELKEANNAIDILGGRIEKIVVYEINKELSHVLIIIKKVKRTEKIYPRIFGKIKKNPL